MLRVAPVSQLRGSLVTAVMAGKGLLVTAVTS
jgi:hypothetical protein